MPYQVEEEGGPGLTRLLLWLLLGAAALFGGGDGNIPDSNGSHGPTGHRVLRGGMPGGRGGQLVAEEALDAEPTARVAERPMPVEGASAGVRSGLAGPWGDGAAQTASARAEATVDARVHAAAVSDGPARPHPALPNFPQDLVGSMSASGLRSLLTLWPPEERARAACIAGAETTGTQVIDWYPPRGAAGECGPWQIHPVHARRFAKYGGWERCADPVVNALVAREIWGESGWQPWTTAPRCN